MGSVQTRDKGFAIVASIALSLVLGALAGCSSAQWEEYQREYDEHSRNWPTYGGIFRRDDAEVESGDGSVNECTPGEDCYSETEQDVSESVESSEGGTDGG